MPDDAEFVHVREAARMLGYDESDTRRLLKRLSRVGTIPRPTMVGKVPHWPRRVVEALARTLRDEPAAG